MTQPVVVQQQQRTNYALTIPRFFMFVACVLFVLAALSLGLKWSIEPWCFGFGGFASVALAWAL